ncbi:hypothetical protein, partial [Streptomyces mirabilis]|uniref:hypothetical protein n=1 Tax=Streptomyces mirabilis TaxID=68239 RepID=UPI00380ABEFB
RRPPSNPSPTPPSALGEKSDLGNISRWIRAEEAALGSTNSLLQSTDLGVRASVRGVSPIDEY